jgi:hypothetical protein
MQVSKWSNVAVAMESALAADVTITAISKANPGVVSTATPPTDGSFIVVTAQGMWQVDGRVFLTANAVAGTSFELEGENTTDYDTFSSGTFAVITFGTTISTAAGLTASGGDFDFLDVTTIHDNIKKQIPGLPNPATYTIENLWDVSDAGLKAMKAASDNQALRAMRFTFANGQILLFTGYVGASLLPTGNAQEVVKTPSVITMFGRPTVYAS